MHLISAYLWCNLWTLYFNYYWNVYINIEIIYSHSSPITRPRSAYQHSFGRSGWIFFFTITFLFSCISFPGNGERNSGCIKSTVNSIWRHIININTMARLSLQVQGVVHNVIVTLRCVWVSVCDNVTTIGFGCPNALMEYRSLI